MNSQTCILFKLMVNSLKRGMILFFFLLIASSVAIAQNSQLSRISNSFDRFRTSVFQEKVFVHTDKEFYLAGDLIWFKIYNTDAASGKLSDLSKVSYVEILDKNNKAVVQAKIGMTKGLGNGSLFLPVSLESGHYVFRAYTGWMMNFSSELFFEKSITVANSLVALNNTPPVKQNYDVQFFPEGGNTVAGRKNAYSTYFVSENKVIKGYKLSVFGSMIPFINYNIKF